MKQKIVFIGNSIVAGYPWSKGKSFVGALRRTLKGDPPSPDSSGNPSEDGTTAVILKQPDFAKNVGFDIINKGVNGDTTEGIARRFQADVLDGNPDFVYFLTGTNDFIFREYTPAEAFAHLEALSEEAEANGVTPIYITPIRVDAEKAECMWMAGFGVSYPAVNRDVDEFSELIRKSGRLYVDMNIAFAGYAKGFDDIDLVYLDGIHPMPNAHFFMAGEILRFMEDNRETLGL